MILTTDDIWTLVIASLVAASCALVGSFLVLRRMSLLGDAISHAVLPGLVIAYLVSGDRSPWWMLVGALLAGLLTTVLTQLLESRAKVESDVGMGSVFTTLFAIGIVLIHSYGRNVDLDADCVLFGDLGLMATKVTTLLGTPFPDAVLPLAVVLVIDGLLITVLWKELAVTSFDPALATTLGLSAGLVHYSLMGAVSVTCVASFESVGAVLVIALLIVPAATAQLIADRLLPFVVTAVLVAVASAVGGVLAALRFDLPEAPTVSVFAGALYGFAVLLAPRHGLLARITQRRSLAIAIAAEDVLGCLYRHQESQMKEPVHPIQGLSRADLLAAGTRPMSGDAGRSGDARLALALLQLRREITRSAAGFLLTEKGLNRASGLIRRHRAWELYLVGEVGLAEDHVHEPAHRMEHFVSGAMADAILEERPPRDPHGKDIPDEK